MPECNVLTFARLIFPFWVYFSYCSKVSVHDLMHSLLAPKQDMLFIWTCYGNKAILTRTFALRGKSERLVAKTISDIGEGMSRFYIMLIY
jgi:hypothetical protein